MGGLPGLMRLRGERQGGVVVGLSRGTAPLAVLCIMYRVETRAEAQAHSRVDAVCGRPDGNHQSIVVVLMPPCQPPAPQGGVTSLPGGGGGTVDDPP